MSTSNDRALVYTNVLVECTGNELGLKAARDDGFQVQGILRLW